MSLMAPLMSPIGVHYKKRTTLWQWHAIDAQGETQQGFDLASSKKSLKAQLRKQKLGLYRCKKESPVALRKPRHALIFLLSQLLALLKSQLDVLTAFDTLVKHSSHRAYRYYYLWVYCHIKEGATLADALSDGPLLKYLPLSHVMLTFAEKSGQLITILQQLIELLEHQINTNQQIWAPLRYPLLVGGFSILVLIGMLWWLVPSFHQLFAQKNELPLLTQIIFWCAVKIRDQSVIYSSLLIISLCVFLFKIKSAYFLQYIPFIKKLFIDANKINYLFILKNTQHAKIPLLQVIHLLGEKEIIFKKLAQHLIMGETLSEALNREKLFPPLIISLIRHGEQHGHLIESLEFASIFMQKQLKSYIDTLTLWLEPLIMLVLSCLISMIVIALYLPIFDLSQTL